MPAPIPLPNTGRPAGVAGVWRATVTRPKPCYVTVERLTGSSEVGPCELADLPEPLHAGDPVWVGAIEGRAGVLAVLARRGDADSHQTINQRLDALDQRITALGG